MASSGGDPGDNSLGEKRTRPLSMRESSSERPNAQRRVAGGPTIDDSSAAGEVPGSASSVLGVGAIPPSRAPIQSTGSIGSLGNIDDLMPGGGAPAGGTPPSALGSSGPMDAMRLLQTQQAGSLITSPPTSALMAVPAGAPSSSAAGEDLPTRGRSTRADAPVAALAPSAHDREDDLSKDPLGQRRRDAMKWSEQEDQMLRVAVAKHGGRNWKSIAGDVPGRNHVQCLQRWRKVLAPGLIKGSWSQDEDDRLLQLVQRGMKNWGEAASLIHGRTAKQCRERWKNHLDPSINKGPWVLEEDKALMGHYEELGQRWAAIAKRLPGRTENAVKIRYKSLSRQAQNGHLPWLKEVPQGPPTSGKGGKGRGRGGRGGRGRGRGRGATAAAVDTNPRGRGRGRTARTRGAPPAGISGSSSRPRSGNAPAGEDDDEDSSPVQRRRAAMALAQLPTATLTPEFQRLGAAASAAMATMAAGVGSQTFGGGTDAVFAAGMAPNISPDQLAALLHNVQLRGGSGTQAGSVGLSSATPAASSSNAGMPLLAGMGLQVGPRMAYGHAGGPAGMDAGQLLQPVGALGLHAASGMMVSATTGMAGLSAGSAPFGLMGLSSQPYVMAHDDLGTLGGAAASQGMQASSGAVGPTGVSFGPSAAMVLATEGSLGAASAGPAEDDNVRQFLALAELGRQTLAARHAREVQQQRQDQSVPVEAPSVASEQSGIEARNPPGLAALAAVADGAHDGDADGGWAGLGSGLQSRLKDGDMSEDGAASASRGQSGRSSPQLGTAVRGEVASGYRPFVGPPALPAKSQLQSLGADGLGAARSRGSDGSSASRSSHLDPTTSLVADAMAFMAMPKGKKGKRRSRLTGSAAMVSSSAESNQSSRDHSEGITTQSTSQSGDKTGPSDDTKPAKRGLGARECRPPAAGEDAGSQHSHETPMSDIASRALRHDDAASQASGGSRRSRGSAGDRLRDFGRRPAPRARDAVQRRLAPLQPGHGSTANTRGPVQAQSSHHTPTGQLGTALTPAVRSPRDDEPQLHQIMSSGWTSDALLGAQSGFFPSAAGPPPKPKQARMDDEGMYGDGSRSAPPAAPVQSMGSAALAAESVESDAPPSAAVPRLLSASTESGRERRLPMGVAGDARLRRAVHESPLGRRRDAEGGFGFRLAQVAAGPAGITAPSTSSAGHPGESDDVHSAVGSHTSGDDPESGVNLAISRASSGSRSGGGDRLDMAYLDRALDQSSFDASAGTSTTATPPQGDTRAGLGAAAGASQLLNLEFQQAPIAKPGQAIVGSGRMMGALFGRSVGHRSHDSSRSSDGDSAPRGGMQRAGESMTSVPVGSYVSTGAAMSRDGPKAVRLGAGLASRSDSRSASVSREGSQAPMHFGLGSAMGSPRNGSLSRTFEGGSMASEEEDEDRRINIPDDGDEHRLAGSGPLMGSSGAGLGQRMEIPVHAVAAPPPPAVVARILEAQMAAGRAALGAQQGRRQRPKVGMAGELQRSAERQQAPSGSSGNQGSTSTSREPGSISEER